MPEVAGMTDVLIRNVPADDLRRIDEVAARLGLSRNEYLLRHVIEESVRASASTITSADFDKLSGLGDEELMRQAWS